MKNFCIFGGDCLDVIPEALRDRSVSLVVTSPPYVMQRRRQYAGVREADYPAWTVRWMEALRPKLAPTASVFINICPHVRDGQLADYVLRTRLALREAGWLELDEIVWHKPDAPPLGRPDRPRRCWESVLWYARTPVPYMDLRACSGAHKRGGGRRRKNAHLSYVHGQEVVRRYNHARPRMTNVFACPIGSIDPFVAHSAMYPRGVPQLLIRTFSPPRGLVLDPFCGSGTSCLVAVAEGRRTIGIDRDPASVTMAKKRLDHQRRFGD